MINVLISLFLLVVIALLATKEIVARLILMTAWSINALTTPPASTKWNHTVVIASPVISVRNICH